MAEKISRKRKRVNKNKKKNWKSTDIEDVEEYLEDRRLQERTGGLVAEKADEVLFFVDKQTENESPVPTKKRRREPKPLRCLASLEPDPRTKPVRVTRNVKPNLTKKKPPTKGQLLKAKVAASQRLTSKRERRVLIRNARKLPSFRKDLWGDEGTTPEEADMLEHHLKVTKQKPVKGRRELHQKPSELPSVEIPHPGSSYNPAFDDHQDLLSKALEVEVKKEKKTKNVERTIRSMSRKKGTGEMIFLTEMSAGLTEENSDNENDDSAEDQDLDRHSMNPPVRREDKKTVTQRNKEKERKAKELKTRQLKEEKQKEQELFRIKQIKKDVNQLLLAREEKIKKKTASKKEQGKTRTKKLGHMKYEEPDIEIKLSDEIEGTLLKLKPEGRLILDRYKSFQKRNIIEPRKRVKIPKRKYKRKYYERK